MTFVSWSRLDDQTENLGHVTCTRHGQLTETPVPEIDGVICYTEHWRAYHATAEQMDQQTRLLERAMQVRDGKLPRAELFSGETYKREDTWTFTIPDSPEGL